MFLPADQQRAPVRSSSSHPAVGILAAHHHAPLPPPRHLAPWHKPLPHDHHRLARQQFPHRAPTSRLLARLRPALTGFSTATIDHLDMPPHGDTRDTPHQQHLPPLDAAA
jgi:hypothetical protein